MPGSVCAMARTRDRGKRSASTPRIASRTAVSSGPSVRSIHSPRQPEHALADDVALDVLRPAADRLREPGQVELRPARGRPVDGGGPRLAMGGRAERWQGPGKTRAD